MSDGTVVDVQDEVQEPDTNAEGMTVSEAEVMDAEAEGTEGTDDESGDDDGENEEGEAQEFRASYEVDADSGITTLTFSGTFVAEIKQDVDPKTGEVIFTSPIYKSPQKNLKDAMSWVGRNMATRAVSAEYERQNPTPKSLPTGRKSAAQKMLEAQVAAAEQRAKNSEERTARLEEQTQATNNMLATLMAKLGLTDVPLPGVTPVGVSDVPTTSESSESDQTDDQGGTVKSISDKRPVKAKKSA